MTDLTLNTRLTADASGLNAALREGAGGVRQFSTQAETAARQAAQAGQQMAGAAQAQAAALRAQQEAMRRTRAEANLLANANRQLPMQVTDIATSLASGMPFWMVAIQQGGQLRDSYNGILPAGRALLGLFNPLRLAIGGAAVVVGTLTAAYFAGKAESDAYAKSIVMSGGAAGVTAGQMDQMARSIDNSVGTQRAAAAVLAQLAEGGRVSRASLQGVAETVVRMERDLGIATDEAVGMFEALGREPVKAAAKLNEQFNFLTLGVYEQIKALMEQGREAEAAALAQRTFSEAMDKRAKQTEERLGLLQRAWRGLGKVASETWDAMLNVGREKTLQERISDYSARIALAQAELAATPANELRRTTDGPRKSVDVIRERIERLQEEQKLLQIQAITERRNAEERAAEAAKVRATIEDDQKNKGGSKAATDRGNAIADAEEAFAERIQQWQRRDQERRDADEQAAARDAAREAERLELMNSTLAFELEAMGKTGAALRELEFKRAAGVIATKEQELASKLAARGGYDDETKAIKRQIDALREQQGLKGQQGAKQDLSEQQRAYDKAKEEEAADSKRRTQAFSDSIAEGITDGYRQGRSLTDIFLAELKAQFAKTILQPRIEPLAKAGNSLLEMIINGAVNLLGGGMDPDKVDPGEFGAIPAGKAGGGRMEPYGDYWVGEQGPERVRMGGRGAYVYPAHASLGGGSGRGGQQLVQNTTIHVGDRVDAAQVYGMALQAARAANAELVDAMNRGEV